MSIATEISRLIADRGKIREKLVELGMANNNANLTTLANEIEKLVNQGAVSVEVREGEKYTIPKGYHNGGGTVLGVSGGGNYNLQQKNATPSKQQQSVTADEGFYGLSSVIVAPIPDAYQDVSSVTAKKENVLTGEVFVTSDGKVLTGEMTNNGAVSKILDGVTVSYVIPKGYHNGSGTVTISVQTKTVTPSKVSQDVEPEAGKVLSKVTVAPIPDEYIVTSDANAEAKHILVDKTAYVDGEKVKGTMPNNEDTSATMDGITTTTVTIPAGYTSGGTVSLSTEIEEQLAAI